MTIKEHLYTQLEHEHIRSLDYENSVPYKYERIEYIDSEGNRVVPVDPQSLHHEAINKVK